MGLPMIASNQTTKISALNLRQWLRYNCTNEGVKDYAVLACFGVAQDAPAKAYTRVYKSALIRALQDVPNQTQVEVTLVDGCCMVGTFS